MASNLDSTVPAERGLLPGAGSFVALLRTATDREPLVAGKPERALHEESVRRTAAERPLVVGDRLDTDIEGATRAATPSLLVFTGVATPRDVLHAPPEHRPSFLGQDLRALLVPAPDVVVDGSGSTRSTWSARAGGWCCEVREGRLAWHCVDADHVDADQVAANQASGNDTGDGLDALRAACAVAWAAQDDGTTIEGTTGDVPEGCAELF